MSTWFNNSFSNYAQQFASTANRLNRLALENAESVFNVQLQTFEKNANATAGYIGELSQATAPTALSSLLPKGLQVARDNLQRMAEASQEIVGIGLKSSETLGELVRQPFAAE